MATIWGKAFQPLIFTHAGAWSEGRSQWRGAVLMPASARVSASLVSVRSMRRPMFLRKPPMR